MYLFGYHVAVIAFVISRLPNDLLVVAITFRLEH